MITMHEFRMLKVGAVLANCDPRKAGEQVAVTKIVDNGYRQVSYVEYKRDGAYRKAKIRADRLHPQGSGKKSNGWRIVSFGGPAQAPHPVQATDDADMARASNEGMIPRRAYA